MTQDVLIHKASTVQVILHLPELSYGRIQKGRGLCHHIDCHCVDLAASVVLRGVANR